MNDQARLPATRADSDFTLSIDEALERYARAGHPRTPRSVQRYCAKGHLDARLVETPFGEKYLIAPESVDKHIAYIDEVTPTTGRGLSRSDAASSVEETITELPKNAETTANDQPRPDATSPDTSRLVALLERENEFLRGQVGVKDSQIKELTERARETNHLVAGLQKMLSPLLGSGRQTDGPFSDRG
jgi:hypothetical protein